MATKFQKSYPVSKKLVTKYPRTKLLLIFVVLFILVSGTLFLLPAFLSLSIKSDTPQPTPYQFPVTVNPESKTISENQVTDTYLENTLSPLSASVIYSTNPLWNVFENLAVTISNSGWYQSVATVVGSDLSPKIVVINPGLRKEQVASLFAKALDWTPAQEASLLVPQPGASLPLDEGSYYPGIYSVEANATPIEVQALLNDRFSSEVLSHYGRTTQDIIPLYQALTVASLIQRETVGTKDMRLVSGIIWNRLFLNMPLQIDSTLQYVKTTALSTENWWPTVTSADKYIKSPYNTYENVGLPPGPIASPSAAAIVAALNPVKTSCLYYFNDKDGVIHCSDTYKEHVKLLAQYY